MALFFLPLTVRGMRSSRRRGFTILETAVALGLSSVILVALVFWVLTLMRTTTSAIELVASNRQADAISTRLEQDMLALVSCAPDGSAPSVVEFTAASFGFFADVVDASGVPGRDGSADFVRWSFIDPSLTRAVVPGTGTCPSSLPVPLASLTLAPSVLLSDGVPMFIAYEGTDPLGAEENCLPVNLFCRPTSVRVRLVVDDNDQPGSAPVALDLSFDVSHADTRL
jgi:type II secretory pathway component PulJ